MLSDAYTICGHRLDIATASGYDEETDSAYYKI